LQGIFTYGVLGMILIPLVSFFLIFIWLRSFEDLTEEIQTKSATMLGEEPVIQTSQNEVAILQRTFKGLYDELQDKVSQLNEYNKKLLDSNVKLSELSIKDELTTLYNRRYFEARLTEEINRVDRYKGALALIMIDVDGFKQYNDTLGHQAGDKLLRELGVIIRSSIRTSDLPFRYGGDEFAILLPECTPKNGGQVAQKIVDLVADHDFTDNGDQPFGRITLSCGVAGYIEGMDEFVAEADKNLYKAKSAGKGQVVLSPLPPADAS